MRADRAAALDVLVPRPRRARLKQDHWPLTESLTKKEHAMTISLDQVGAAHSDAGLTLTTPVRSPVRLEPRDDGTFLFPPASYTDVAAYVNFWITVPISDSVLTNITKGYADLIRRQGVVVGSAWAQPYDYAHKNESTSSKDAVRAAANRARIAAHQVVMDEWFETHPERIKAGAARSIARAGQLFYYSSALSDEDKVEVKKSTMMVGDKELTIAEIESLYQLREIREHFQDLDANAADRLEDIRIELQRLQGAT
jgi:hypothetical protein